MRWFAVALLGCFLVLGCAQQDPAAPPSGWEASESRWWQEDVDTSEVFSNMSDLVAMGVIEEKVAAQGTGQLSQDQFERAVKRSLLTIYRNNPTLVDSLFEEYAVPKLQGANLGGEALNEQGAIKSEILNKYRGLAYKAINEHYREPQQQEGASGMSYPDSLRTEETSGTVELQAHVDTTGQIIAIEVLQSVHPTLDAIAMQAAITDTAWEPAYLLRNNEWIPQPSWVRFSVNFDPQL